MIDLLVFFNYSNIYAVKSNEIFYVHLLCQSKGVFKHTVPQFLSDSLPGPVKYQTTHRLSLSSAKKASGVEGIEHLKRSEKAF